jgi:hypothetical protein
MPCPPKAGAVAGHHTRRLNTILDGPTTSPAREQIEARQQQPSQDRHPNIPWPAEPHLHAASPIDHATRTDKSPQVVCARRPPPAARLARAAFAHRGRRAGRRA